MKKNRIAIEGFNYELTQFQTASNYAQLTINDSSYIKVYEDGNGLYRAVYMTQNGKIMCGIDNVGHKDIRKALEVGINKYNELIK